MLGKGLKKFGEEGSAAAKAELNQMGKWTCFRAIAVAEPTHQERIRTQERLMILTRKQYGTVKGQLAYNGKRTQDWISKEDKSSLTVSNEIIILTSAVDGLRKGM